jgi:nucleoside-diphosphate-sugar epimerase
MAKKYLVTGGTGFIGSALVKRLVRDGFEVRVLDNNIRGTPERLIDVKDQIEIIDADVRDPLAVVKACEGVDAVIHLAFINGTEFFYTKPELVLEVGVKGMVNVLDGCIKHGIRELVLASSSEVYQTPPRVPTDESAPLSIPDPLNPRYSYAGGKIISELMAVNYGRVHFDRVLIFRPHNVYGPDMGWEHVIPQFALRMRQLAGRQKGKTLRFPIQGSGKETRAFCFIDDFVDALMLVLEKGKHLNIYHIGVMQEKTIKDVASKMGEYFGRRVVIEPGKLTQGSTKRRCPDIRKIRKLGFKPKVSFGEGVSVTTKWYDENAHKRPKKT